MTHAVGHPIVPPSGVVAICRLVLYETIGPGEHECHWCAAPIAWKLGLSPGAIVADHLNGDRNDDRPENIVASCNVCNVQRTRTGSKLIRPGDLFVTNKDGTKHRASEQTCADCGTPFLARITQIRVGKGRYCSRSCARRAQHRH